MGWVDLCGILISLYRIKVKTHRLYIKVFLHIAEKREAVFSLGKFDSFLSYFFTLYPTYIHILLIHCILMSKKLFIPKITSQNVKNAAQFSSQDFHLWWAKILVRLPYLLQSES